MERFPDERVDRELRHPVRRVIGKAIAAARPVVVGGVARRVIGEGAGVPARLSDFLSQAISRILFEIELGPELLSATC